MIAAVDDLVREIAMEMRISVLSAHTVASEKEHYRKSVRGGFLGVEHQK